MKLSIILLAAAALPAAVTTARTEAGTVAGVATTDKAIVSFKGIPYAAPPVGDLRWHAPMPAAKWTGTKQADHNGPSCPQRIVTESKPWTYEFMTHGEISEDCLSLDVWTGAASASEKRPVLVYFYGGANREGSVAVPAYDGENLARKGLVVVTFNYRLGILGFFTHPDLKPSGNYALLDQIALLRWVKNNIAAFGGDAARVTIAGQSAGASDIQLLTVSPLAKGLFRGAIMESGGSNFGAGGRPLAAAEADGVKFAATRTLAELRAIPFADILKGAPNFGPTIGNEVVPLSPRDAFALGKQNDVVTMAGWNADENGASPVPNTDVARLTAQLKQQLGEDALKLYPFTTDDEAKRQSNEAARDRQRVAGHLWAAQRAATSKTPAYLYFWNHVLPGPDSGIYGAFHTSEVPYVFNSLKTSDRPFTPADTAIADMMSSYWANFAKTGDPNGKGLATWPADGPQLTIMQLGDKPGAIPLAGSEAKTQFLLKALAPKP